jgi:hypothetical protein
MRYVGAFIAVSCLTGVLAAVGCGAKTTPSGAGGGSSSSSSSASSSSSSSSSSGAGGGGGAGGAAGAGGGPSLVCTLPATPPSMGACVGFTTDAGVELDAGVNSDGGASTTTCNPITNDGCTGTDTCQPDTSNSHYYCQPVGTMPNIAPCGDCTAAQAFCAKGGLCVGITMTMAACIQMCCTDADCGGVTGSCQVTGFLQNDLPMSVGLCVNP